MTISYNVTEQTRRTQHTGNGSAGPFTFTFQINATSEIKVYVDSTLKTITTHYTVALDSTTGAGTVSFTSGNFPTSSQTITLLSNVSMARTSTYTTGGNLTASSLENDFDTQMFLHQQNDELSLRALHIPEHDTISSADMTLPSKDNRKGKYLAFNSTTGNPEAGAGGDDITTLSAISSDIQTLAHLQDGTVATNGLSSLNSISANITTVAGMSASNITTVAGLNTEITQVYNDRTDIQNAEENATKAQNYATKVDGAVPSTTDYSSKAWAIGGTGVTDTSGSGSAKSWAVETDQVDGTEHSSKTYAVSGSTLNAGSAKNWALGGGDSFASGTTIGTSGLYSAKYYAEQAAASKTEFSNVYQGALSSDPSGGSVSVGDLYFNTSTTKLKYYDGSAWVNIEAVDTSSFATAGFSIAMGIAL
tara:strand:- start:633 stop:1892 length:1260 start_codon:yes stop_codon:yes gene_type:complete